LPDRAATSCRPSWTPARVSGTAEEIWRERRASNHKLDQSGVWRFREFLPETPEEAVVTLFEGNVPLIPGLKTAAYAGVEHLWFKHLGWNPTGRSKIWG
jgi:threonine synthase